MSKKISGTVVKKSGHQTISVLVKRRINHPLYSKQMTRTNKLLVHDPNNTAVVGQEIVIESIRPISKLKHFVVSSPPTDKKTGKKND